MTESHDVSLEEKGLILYEGFIFSAKDKVEYENLEGEEPWKVELSQGILFTGKTYFGGEPLYQVVGTMEDQVLVEIVGGTYDNGIAPIPMPDEKIGERSVLSVEDVATVCHEQQNSPSN